MENIPQEFSHDTLITLPYNYILSFCKTNGNYHKLIEDKYFWTEKAKKDIGEDAILFFDNQSVVDSYLELLSQYQYFKGCEKFIDNKESFLLGVRNKNLDAVKNVSLSDNYCDDVIEKYKLCKDLNYVEGLVYLSTLMNTFNHSERPEELIMALKGETYEAVELCTSFDEDRREVVDVLTLKAVLHGLAIIGDLKAFKFLFDRFSYLIDDYSNIIRSAAMENRETLVDYLLQKENDTDNFYEFFSGAIHGGNFNLADKILRLGLQRGLTLDNFCIKDGIFTQSSFEYLLNLAAKPLDGSCDPLANPKFIYRCMKNCGTLEIIKLFYNKLKSGEIKYDKLYDKLMDKLLTNAIKKGNTYMIKYMLFIGADINKSIGKLNSLKYSQEQSHVIPTLLFNKVDKFLINELLYNGSDIHNMDYLNKLSHVPRYKYFKLYLIRNWLYLAFLVLFLIILVNSNSQNKTVNITRENQPLDYWIRNFSSNGIVYTRKYSG